MSIKISEETVQNTTKCQRKFQCLSGERVICRVNRLVNKKILFVHKPERGGCPYLLSYGYSSFICQCPVRIELYREHHV